VQLNGKKPTGKQLFGYDKSVAFSDISSTMLSVCFHSTVLIAAA